MPKVAVVIPARNEEKYIGKTLLSLQKQTVKPVAIIVIDDGSTDRTVNVVKEFKRTFRECFIHFISLNRSSGYGKGIVRNLNEGKKWLDDNLIHYDYLLVLDADQRLSHDYIKLCLDAFDPSTAIVSGRTHGTKFNPIQPRGAHRVYAKWFIDKYPFPSLKGYDSHYFFQALENNYKVKIIRDAIAYEDRVQRLAYVDDLDRGIYSYKLGYSLPFILARSIKNMISFHRLKAILIIYGFLFSFITRKKRYSIYKQISLYQKLRIKRKMMEILP
ncbi:MAG: glycosyltransferase family 2 protein [Promethearchaeota archaeon]